MNSFHELDMLITKSIYFFFQKVSSLKIILYISRIIYEFYEKIGLYTSILQVLWFGIMHPIQFHLLPLWFSYYICEILKENINKTRPGCLYKELNTYILNNSCKTDFKNRSFPSKYTTIAAALGVALIMEMKYSHHPKFFEISINNESNKKKIIWSTIFIIIFVGIQRIVKGYHSFFDTISGALIGIFIGFISWSTLEYYKYYFEEICNDVDHEFCEEVKKKPKINSIKNLIFWFNKFSKFQNKLTNESYVGNITSVGRLVLTIPILYLLLKFFSKDLIELIYEKF